MTMWIESEPVGGQIFWRANLHVSSRGVVYRSRAHETTESARTDGACAAVHEFGQTITAERVGPQHELRAERSRMIWAGDL